MAKRPQSILSVAAPCGENWDTMQQLSGGQRHCDRCAHAVVDFSTATDAAILAYMLNGPGKVCGRFRRDQLERPLVPAYRHSKWRYFKIIAAAGMLVLSHTPLVHAQDTIYNTVTELVSDVPDVDKPLLSSSDKSVIEGVIKDEQGNLLEGVSIIMVENMSVGTFSDENGCFSFAIPEEWKGKAIKLVIDYASFQIESLSVDPSELPLYKVIILKMPVYEMGYFNVGYISEEPVVPYYVNRMERILDNRRTAAISGVIINGDGLPLDKVDIQVVNTRIGMKNTTKDDGVFLLEIPRNFSKNYCRLHISREGYVPVKKWVNLAKEPETLKVKMVKKR